MRFFLCSRNGLFKSVLKFKPYKMWSNGSKSLTILVHLSFLVAVVAGRHFLCDQAHTRKTSSTLCGNDDAYLCQAVLDASLDVQCWKCPKGIDVSWTMTDTSGQEVELETTSQILHISASNVTTKVAGCYQCQCAVAGELFGLKFSVTVAAGAKPSFTVQTDGGHKDVYQLQPYNRSVILNDSVSGIVVVDCSATGYPDPTYTWQVTVNGTNIGDSCIRVKDGGKKLNFIPTPWNTKEQMLFTCTVQNDLQDGTITGVQQIDIDAEEWQLHPVHTQSGSVMHLINGIATGVVAVSRYGVEYYICANMTAVTPTDNPACSFDSYMNEGKCCPCTASPCHPGLDLRMSETRVTVSEELGVSTDGCNFTTSTEQHLLFFARKFQDNSFSKVYQLIGFTEVKSSPTVIASPSLGAGEIVGFTLGVVIALAICIIAAVVIGCITYVKRRQNKQIAEGDLGEVHGNPSLHESLLAEPGEDTDATEQPILIPDDGVSEYHESMIAAYSAADVPSVIVHAGQDEHHLHPTAHCTSPNTFEYTIPDGIIQAKKDCRVVVNCNNQSVDVSFTAVKCSSLCNQVRKIHDVLERGLHLDWDLLAQLNQRNLLTTEEFSDINAILQAHNSPSAGRHFVNSVLFQWPPEVFESNVSRLTEALESHEDGGNQKIAGRLRNAYSESEQPLPSDHPNPDNTADMPSLTVRAGPDEYPLQLTPHSTAPNTFGCVIPEQIRLEAGKEYRFVVNYGNKSVIVSFSVARYSRMDSSTSVNSLTNSGKRGKAMFEQVQKIQSKLAIGLSLDETLLAQLREHRLLTREEVDAINAHILGHNQSAAGRHFVNLVLFGWSFEVFESNVRQLIEALQSHDDSGNQAVAGKLQRALVECGLEMHDPCPAAAFTNGNS